VDQPPTSARRTRRRPAPGEPLGAGVVSEEAIQCWGRRRDPHREETM